MKRPKMKPILLLAALLAMAVNVAAGPITPDEARGNAMAFLTSGTGMKRAKGIQTLTLAYTLNTKDTKKPALYAFNIDDGNGFVITSGDDIAEPILGYCDTGSLDPNNIPSNVKAWLDGYASEISKAQASGYTPAANAPAKAKATINPLVQSKWNQTAPYNDQCIFNNVRCLTGCAATAMAQIMYYWASVGKGGSTFKLGSTALPSYTTSTNGYTIPALSAVSSFDWANMTNNTPTTTAGKAAVAKLMRYCGQAAEMDYTTSGSAAYMSLSMDALKNNFGYNFGIKHIYASSYTNDEWNDIIYNQLADGKPVFMSGYSENEGHAFICDGYDTSKSKFHFNWGWGGLYDGWFTMTALKPSTHNFSEDKDAIINIQPLENSAYAILSSNASTLTFYYDRNRSSRTGTLYEVPMDGSYPKWLYNNNITSTSKVVFDSSFASAKPESTYYWFSGMTSLSSITGMANLNTSELKSTHRMFYNCSALASIDLSIFYAAKVTDMSYMFYGCSGLKSLNASSFNTANVTDMSSMFYGCSGLTSINVSKFNTAKVTNMANMFNGCSGLASINVSSFNTANVTNMRYMFYGCSGLTSINVSNFNTAKVTTLGSMFYGCSKLTSLDLSTFDLSSLSTSDYLCRDCSALTSLKIPSTAGKLSSYTFSGVGKSSAPCFITAPSGFDFGTDTNVMSFQWKSGYFYLVGAKVPYAYINGNQLNFCYDADVWTHDAASLFSVANTGSSNPGWYSSRESITSVVINSGFVNARPKSTCRWFSGMTNVETITGLQYLNTENVTNMYYMFSGSSALKSLNLSKMSTANVTNMSYMFQGCSALTSLDLSNMNTANVTNMACMFYGCTELTSVNLSNLNTAKVTNISYMFSKCSKLKSLDLSSCNFSAVTNSNYFCQTCSSLSQLTIPASASYITHSYAFSSVGKSTAPCIITAPDGFDFGTDTSALYFKWLSGYFNLAGANAPYAFYSNGKLEFCNDAKAWTRGTTLFNVTSTGTSSPGWYSKRDSITTVVINSAFAKIFPQSTYQWFGGMSKVTSITGLNYLSTDSVKMMAYMFSGCSALESINLSNMNTGKVTNMNYMFQNCSALTSLDLSKMNTSNVTSLIYLFSGCSRLSSINLSNLNTAKVTNMSYLFQNCSALENIDLSKLNTANVTNMSYMFSGCTELSSVNLSNLNTTKVTNISYMFSKCSKLKSIDLSSCNFSAVTSSTYFCQNCSSLSQLTIPATASTLTNSYAFSGVGTSTAPCIITAPAGFDFGVTTSSLYFKWKSGYFFLKGTEMAYAFLKDGKLTFLCDANPWGHDATPYNAANTGTSSPGWYSQRDQVTEAVIDASFAKARPLSTYNWFSGMTNLATVSGIENLNMSETTNSNSMFNLCSSLEEITLPTTIKLIGSNMFRDCSSLKSIIVPEGVTTINSNAFYNCSALESATLPSTLETLGSYNFYNCQNLTAVTVKFTVPLTLASTNFSNRRNADLFVPEGCSEAFKGANYWKDFKWICEGNGYALGDVDHNGSVSLTDIMLTVSYILEDDPTGFYTTNADIDHSGDISLVDVMMIVNIVLSQ